MSDDSHVIAMLHQAACLKSDAADAEWKAALEAKRPFMLLRPRMFPDGSQWCALYGDNLQDGVAGFGDTPEKAAIQFDIEWLNARTSAPPEAERVVQREEVLDLAETALEHCRDKELFNITSDDCQKFYEFRAALRRAHGGE